MNKSKPATGSQSLVSEIQLARLRLAQAESSLKSAREQASMAKRKRKEAKQAARRARKQVKQAKSALQESKQVLLAAEAKLALARKRAALVKKRAQAPKVVKAAVPKSGGTKRGAAPRRSRSPLSTVPAAAAATPPSPNPPDVQRPLDATTSRPDSDVPTQGGYASQQIEAGTPEPATTAGANPMENQAH